MFLEKSAARLISFAAHTLGLAALLVGSTPEPLLPRIEPPCADVLTWVRVRPWMFPPPPAQPPQPPAPDDRVGSSPGDSSHASDDPLPVPGHERRSVQGVCGCVLGGWIVEGLPEGLPAPEPPPPLPVDPLPTVPLRAGDDVPIPAKISDVAPVYPPLARRLRLDGLVVLDATIDEFGQVVDVRILKSVTVFDRAAVQAVKRWRYAPAIRNGLPVRVLLTVTVAFTYGKTSAI